MDVCYLQDDVPDLPYRYRIESDPECLDGFTFSIEDDRKINHAAQWGPLRIQAALAGDPDALAELRCLGITRWWHKRRNV